MYQSMIDLIINWLPMILIIAVVLIGSKGIKSSYSQYLQEHNRITKDNTQQLSRIADALEQIAKK